MARYCATAAAVLIVFVVLLLAGAACALVDPHVTPEPCDSCHRKTPTKEEGERGDYFLLKDSIDATCHVCHVPECCKVGSMEGHIKHPSGVDTWDTSKFQKPKTVPLFKGFMTCSTCHMHSRPDGESFKLVRLVTRDGMRIEWIRLCRDCHTLF